MINKIINYILLLNILCFLILFSYGQLKNNKAIPTAETIKEFLSDQSITEAMNVEWDKQN